MQLSNYHSHCNFCDGRSYPEDFVRFAVARGFRAYGFSSHSPLPFETFWNMSRDDMDEYLAEIARLKAKYEGQIELYVGLEVDFLDRTYNASIPYFKNLPLDYRIGSIHFLPLSPVLEERNMACIDGAYSEFARTVDAFFEGDIRRMVRRYFEAEMEMVEAGGIDIVGHIDKIYMNGQRYPGFSLDAEWYRRPLLDLLDFVRERGLMVEVNTKNLVKKGETYPHRQFLGELRSRRIPVMVNSDCHYPDLVNDGRAEGFLLLEQAGFDATMELVGGKWTEIGLRREK